MYKIITLCFLAFLFNSAFSQTGNVGIGTSSPDATAKLDVTTASDAVGSKKGLLVPRVALTSTKDQNTVHTPTTSVLVYNTTAANTGDSAVVAAYYYFNGTVWVRLLNNTSAWQTVGNTGNTTPAIPGTYGTSALASPDNWLGNIDGKDLVFGTTNLERMRLKHSGSFAIGTATTTSPWDTTFNLSVNSYKNAQRSGIYMQFAGSGTITSTAYGLDVDAFTNTNANVRGYRFRSSTTGSGVLYGTGSELTATNIVSGYTGYRNSSGLSYALYGINGTNATYATNANTWALWAQGRAVISSESSPSSVLGTDLEIRNTLTGPRFPPSTLTMRQTTSLSASGDTLARIYFGDNYQTAAQAEIRVIRPAAASSTSDLPTALSFYCNADAFSTMAERMRIGAASNNTSEVWVNKASPYTGDVFSATSDQDGDFGVNGYNTSTTATGLNGGVYGEVRNAAGTALWGYNTTTNGNAIFGAGNNITYYYLPGPSSAPYPGSIFSGLRYGSFSYMADTTSTNASTTNYKYNATYAGGIAYVKTKVSVSANMYHFGLHGTQDDIGTQYGRRSGGVIGTTEDAGTLNAWGVLGYVNSASGFAGVYGSVAYASGAGYLESTIYNGAGGMFFGGLAGSVNKGKLFGSLTSGDLLAAYNAGDVVTSGRNAELVETNSDKKLAYSVTSTSLKIYADGNSLLINGKARVNFDDDFLKMSNGKTPTVTITAIGKSNGLYIESVDANGFTVAENNNGKSNITFNWISVGTRVDNNNKIELPNEMYSSDFDKNLKEYMVDDYNREGKDAKPFWWDGSKFIFGIEPPKKISTEAGAAIKVVGPKKQKNKITN